MKRAQPRGLSRRRVEEILSKTKSHGAAGSRIEVFSREFLGNPYNQNTLIGSADTPEVFTASLDGFDCVTYVETILALSRASNVDSFVHWLRKIRYAKGSIAWERRNHYMTDWIRNNVREGIIRPLSFPGAPKVSRERILNVVPGLQSRRTRVTSLPKSALRRFGENLKTGDLIFFASTRKNLDIFHTGIIIRNGGRLFLRQAQRSRGAVVDQDLNDFLKTNRMAGVILVRPI